MANAPPIRVFVMEGKWETFLPSRASATQLLGLLEDEGRIKTDRRNTVRRRLLRRSFEDWAAARDFPIGYVAAHGDDGLVSPRSWGRSAALGEISSWIGPGGATRRVLVLGTCSTLEDLDAAKALVRETGLLALCGYTKSVRTIYAAVMDTLLLDELATAWQTAGQPTTRGLKTRVAGLEHRYAELTRRLGFTAVWSD